MCALRISIWRCEYQTISFWKLTVGWSSLYIQLLLNLCQYLLLTYLDMKTEEKSPSTRMGIGRHGFQCQFDFLSISIQACKTALVPVSIFVQCSELWISFPLHTDLASATSTAHIWLQCYYHNLEGNIKHSRQQTHSKKESEAKLHILPELKKYTPVGSISHICLWVPNAMTNTTWSEEACAFSLTPSDSVWYNMQWACYEWNIAYQLS